MRLEHETATSFNELKEITQAIHVLKNSTQANANNQASEPTQEQGNKPKATAHAKNHALKPTKKAFSERQKTTIRDRSQASDHTRLEELKEQGNNANANAFKSDEATQNGNQKQPRKPKRGQE
ncbi:hypothetical protein ECC37_07095 [Helicobacter pylori]|uniref:hypothetical protein n=1 Tax=Helicobacter pylori TaxID=210 RepID=UPI000FDE13C9|nr:hypothetical protein [Helicobacter pylori]RVY62885.1 hypothetical protein ECC37_07095 [Helicobacter pylori]